MQLINISKRELPPVGKTPAVVSEAVCKTTKDPKGKERQELALKFQLSARDSRGRRFVVPKRYILDTRGLTRLHEDIKTLRGAKTPSPQEFENFNPEDEFVNKSCELVANHGQENG